MKKFHHILNTPFLIVTGTGHDSLFLSYRGKKDAKRFGYRKKAVYLHRFRADILGYGVMVTLQILVLPFLVRVRVAQQKEGDANAFPLFLP